MSSNPGGTTNLGESLAKIGFFYDPAGEKAFEAAAKRLGVTAAQVTQQLATPTAAAAASAARVKGLSDEEKALRKIATAKAADARLEEQAAAISRRTTLARLDSAEKVAFLRTELAKLNQGSLAYLKTEEQLARAEATVTRERAAQTQAGAGGAARGILQGLGVGSILGGVGIAGGVALVSRQVVQLTQESLDLAVKASTIGTAFDAATERAGLGADELLKKLNTAARGTVATANLELSANKALALGVGANAQQIADLLSIARQKGKDFGEGTAKAFEDIVTGIGRASPLILDNLGITIDADRTYKAYAASIGTTVGALDKQQKIQALVNRVIADNTDLIQKNATATLDAGDKIAKAQAEIEDAKTRAGSAALPLVASVASQGATFVESVTGQFSARAAALNRQLAAQATSAEDYVKRFNAAVARLNPSGLSQSGTDDELVGQYLALQQLTAAQVEAIKIEIAHAAQLDKEAAAHDGDAAAARRNAAAQAQRGLGLIDVPDALPGITADETLARHQQLTAGIIAAGEQLTSATSARDDKLLALDQNYATSSGRLFADLSQAQIDGVNERARIEADGAKRVADTIAAEGLRASRQVEDRARTDARTARSRREEDAASADTYAQNRANLISGQHDQAVKDEESYQRDLARATREGQRNQYASTASYLERLFDLTRGRRNKGTLEQGQAVLRNAQAEAAELAKSDPAAAAALIAEREKQFLDGLDRTKQEAQLRRDAKRGGGLSAADVEAEIAQERAAIDASNQAAIDGIKAGAKDKADDRARESTERDTANQEAIDDLDTTEAERKQKLAAARAEQDADLAADRRSEDQRRAQDYAKQLADLRRSNGEALAQFDTNQAAKIAKIKAAIADEKTKYDAQHKQILSDYDTLSKEIQDKIDTAKRLLDVSPAEEDVKRQEAALKIIGRRYGQAILDGYTDALGLPRIVLGPATGPIGTGSAFTGQPGNAPTQALPPVGPLNPATGTIHSQALHTAWSAMDRPELPQAPAAVGTTISAPVTVDMRGASFGPGVDPQEIERAVGRGALVGANTIVSSLRTQVAQSRTQGQRR